ncbi:MAG: ABC transporter permease [Anaerolineales bacterium]
MSRTLLLFAWRDLVRRPWQSGLMLLGVVLGVAVMVSIDVANVSARRGFSLSTEAVVGRATHRIEGGPSGVPEAFYVQLRTLGWQDTAPIVEGIAIAPDLQDRPLRLLGIDLFSDAVIRPTFGLDAWTQAGAERFFLEPDAVIIPAGLAREGGLLPGDRFRLFLGNRVADLRILGVWTPPENDPSEALDDVVWMDIAAAQELTGTTGRLTRIDLIAARDDVPGIAALLPPGVSLVPASQQAETVRQLSDAFQLNLTALSLLALMVGMFLIYNSTMFHVVQRRQILATLGVLGAESGQIARLILGEAAAVATVGAVLGLPFGWALGQTAVRLVTQTINDFYFTLSVRQAPLEPATAAKAVAIALGAALLAAAGPALEAARIPPVAAFQRSDLEERASRGVGRAAGAGLASLAAGALLLAAAQRSLALSLGGMFGVLVGLALMVPLSSRILLLGLVRLLPRLRASRLRWGLRSVVRSLSRTSVALAALMVALAVTIGLGTMIASFRQAVDDWLDLTLRADVYVSSPLGSGSQPRGDISPEWESRLGSVPGVARVEPFRAAQVATEFGPARISAVDSYRIRDARLYRSSSGTAEEVWNELRQGSVLVSESFLQKHGLRFPMPPLTLTTDRGPRSFSVAAVFYDYSSEVGTVMMTQEVYHQFWSDRWLSSLGVFLAPQASFEDVARGVRNVLAGTGLHVTTLGDVRQRALAIFDRSFEVTSALRLLSVLVAGVGMMSALLALQLERAREVATLQVLGMTPRELGAQILLENGIMGVLAALLSVPTGLLLAWILTKVINLRSFGWAIPWSPGLEPIAIALGLSLLAAWAAGLYPWWRVSRAPIAERLRAD